MTEKAIHAARRRKQEIEAQLEDLLHDFTADTGLAVVGLTVERIEITGMGDDTRRYRYRVKSDIVVDE